MKDLSEILEEEFSEAVEVKNPKSLHRCFALLTGTYVEQETHERRYNELSSNIKEMLASMKEGFRRVDERFEAQQKQSDERFAAQDTHFNSIQKQMDLRFETTQKQMHEQFTALQKQMDIRFEATQKQMHEQFTALQKQMDERFTAQERRFDDMNRRFDKQHKLISLGFTAITLIIAAFNLTLILS